MYVEDKYAIYHYAALYKNIEREERFHFYKDSIKRASNDRLAWNNKVITYIDLDLLEDKKTILNMMYSDDVIDRKLAYEILKTNGCFTECDQSK